MSDMLIVSKELYNYHKNHILDLLSEMNTALLEKAESLKDTHSSYVRELYTVRNIYIDQVQASIDNIENGEYSIGDFLHLSSTVYLSNLRLRWLLELQTRDFQKLIDDADSDIRKDLEKAHIEYYNGNDKTTLKLLHACVQKEPDNYPVLMTTGCYYLDVFNKPEIAIKFFAKSVKSANQLESDHFKILAVHHMVSTHVILDEKEKALALLQKLELKGRVSGPLFYSMAQLYAMLSQGEKALHYFQLALKRHPIYFSRAIMDPSFDGIRDEIHQKLDEYDSQFRVHGIEFRAKMNRLFEIADDFELVDFRPSLEKQLALIEKQLNRVNVDCFTGYRTGIVRYFQGTFPEVLYELGDTIIRKHAITLRKLRKKQSKAEKKTGLPYFVFMPIIGASTAFSVHFIQKPVIQSLNLDFPLSDIILPNLFPFFMALAIMFIFVKTLRAIRMPSKREMNKIKEMGKVERELKKIEKELSEFWDQKISKLVEVTAIWR